MDYKNLGSHFHWKRNKTQESKRSANSFRFQNRCARNAPPKRQANRERKASERSVSKRLAFAENATGNTQQHHNNGKRAVELALLCLGARARAVFWCAAGVLATMCRVCVFFSKKKGPVLGRHAEHSKSNGLPTAAALPRAPSPSSRGAAATASLPPLAWTSAAPCRPSRSPCASCPPISSESQRCRHSSFYLGLLQIGYLLRDLPGSFGFDQGQSELDATNVQFKLCRGREVLHLLVNVVTQHGHLTTTHPQTGTGTATEHTQPPQRTTPRLEPCPFPLPPSPLPPPLLPRTAEQTPNWATPRNSTRSTLKECNLTSFNFPWLSRGKRGKRKASERRSLTIRVPPREKTPKGPRRPRTRQRTGVTEAPKGPKRLANAPRRTETTTERLKTGPDTAQRGPDRPGCTERAPGGQETLQRAPDCSATRAPRPNAEPLAKTAPLAKRVSFDTPSRGNQKNTEEPKHKTNKLRQTKKPQKHQRKKRNKQKKN